MCVSATLILDTFDAFNEYCGFLDHDSKESKVSRSLLTRYIYESYVNFLYIFKVKKGLQQTRTKAFFYYGDFKKNRMQEKEEFIHGKVEWKKYISEKGKTTQWHGKNFQEITKETNYSPLVYQVLSQFTHPGIFTLERILNSDMFNGIIEDSIVFTSAAICDMMSHSYNLRLYGLKLNSRNEKEINDLVKAHEEMIQRKQNENEGQLTT